MPIISEKQIIDKTLISIAEKMLIAARTAPKGKGQNNIEIKLATGNDIVRISEKMKLIGDEKKMAFFHRDAENILQSPVVFLVAVKVSPLGLDCGYCGFDNCKSKIEHKNVPCTFNTIDLGIAIGSAVNTASYNKADNRVMYSVGTAVKEMSIFDNEYQIVFGIPLSASSKSPFFDRK